MIVLLNYNFREVYVANTMPTIEYQRYPRNISNAEWLIKQGGNLRYMVDPDRSDTSIRTVPRWCIEFEDEKLAMIFLLRWA